LTLVSRIIQTNQKIAVMLGVHMNRKGLMLVAVIAALYDVLGLVFASISFGPVQVRVSNILIPMIAIFGLPGVIGTVLGTFTLNLYGYAVGIAIGPLDLISAFVFLPARWLIARYGLKAVLIHTLCVGLWVGYLLNNVFGLPFLVTAPLVMGGEAVAEIVLGVPVTLALQRRLPRSLLK
jgi:uncharacterized membrane protein